MSDSLWLHGLQHARPPCPSPTPGVYSNSCPLSQWCHPIISSPAILLSSCLQFFPASIRVFSIESVIRIRWPNYWSFSFNISPSNEYSGLISFRIEWLGLLAVQGTLQHHNSKASILWYSAFFIVQLSVMYLYNQRERRVCFSIFWYIIRQQFVGFLFPQYEGYYSWIVVDVLAVRCSEVIDISPGNLDSTLGFI